MKRIYVAYKFAEEDPIELRKRLEALSKVIEEATGCKTFIFFRDAQKWQKSEVSIKEIVIRALNEIDKCDAILVEASTKARGAYLEAGYAKALKKKVIIIHKTGTEANFLEAIADVAIEYDNLEDLRKKLKNKDILT